MPQFIRKADVVSACLYDGSADAAIECVRAIGKPLTLTFDDGKPVLSYGKQQIEPGRWVAIRDGSVSLWPREAFEEEFQAIGGPACTPDKTPSPVPVVVSEPPARGLIAEGDVIRDRDDPEALELEVLEWDKDNQQWICDSVWGQKEVPFARAVILRKGPAL